MTMVERVAEAMRAQLAKSGSGSITTDMARAAIEAMREPTIEMRKVSSFEAAEQDWPAMIDAALKD